MRIKCSRCKIGLLYRFNGVDLHKCNNCGKSFTTKALNEKYHIDLPIKMKISIIILFILLFTSISYAQVLNVSISAPVNLTTFNLYTLFNITVKVTCQVADCNNVFATPRFNFTTLKPFTPINSSTKLEKPLAVVVSRYAMSIWNKTYNPGTIDEAKGIVSDKGNNMYVVGSVQNTNRDMFVMKINHTGNSIWNRTYDFNTTDAGLAVTIDSSGNNIYVVGNRSGDWIVMKINTTGNSIWNKTYNPSIGTDIINAVTIDSSNNNIYVAGSVSANANWGIQKINTTGYSIWNRTYNPGTTDRAFGITIDSSNNIYVVGMTGGNNWFISKLNATGGSIWNRTYNPGATDVANAVVIDKSSNIYVAGYQDATNFRIMKINATGGSIWNRTYNPGTTDAAWGIAMDTTYNNIYVVGQVNLVNWFIMKIDINGNSIWNKTYNPGATDVARAAVMDSNNNLYMAGDTSAVNWFISKLDNSLSYQMCGNLTATTSCIFDWVINASRNRGYSIGVYFNASQSSSLINVTDNMTIRVGIGDGTRPSFYQNNTNKSIAKFSEHIRFNINWTDNIALFRNYFETNITGIARNYTTTLSGKTQRINITNITHPTLLGKFYWKSYTNDTQGNMNSTNRQFIIITSTTTSTPPSVGGGGLGAVRQQQNISIKICPANSHLVDNSCICNDGYITGLNNTCVSSQQAFLQSIFNPNGQTFYQQYIVYFAIIILIMLILAGYITFKPKLKEKD